MQRGINWEHWCFNQLPSPVSLDGGVGYGKSGTLVGGDISSNGLKPSMSVAGISLPQINSAAGKMTTKSWGISTPPVPIGPFTLTLGYNYLRYYSDETANVNLIGSLKASATASKNLTHGRLILRLPNPDAAGGVLRITIQKSRRAAVFLRMILIM
ncbi:MAG: hypothetical protein IPK96_11285 [Flammeovirgaceae bacterium]|nr:hypothetical protein [Flammeovirgaceae bacterium]